MYEVTHTQPLLVTTIVKVDWSSGLGGDRADIHRPPQSRSQPLVKISVRFVSWCPGMKPEFLRLRMLLQCKLSLLGLAFLVVVARPGQIF